MWEAFSGVSLSWAEMNRIRELLWDDQRKKKIRISLVGLDDLYRPRRAASISSSLSKSDAVAEPNIALGMSFRPRQYAYAYDHGARSCDRWTWEDISADLTDYALPRSGIRST
jgi:hypothetical protein